MRSVLEHGRLNDVWREEISEIDTRERNKAEA